ncbi:ATP-binding response regulator [Thalassoroseus pseudoceratinae]|uniref:ATP-binding response regulator n=1 Tax=Thalassoroseus pseudoceratinae TaxID=2713176 RepID=UPI0014212668|nr:response regulator [Thalassoroseus pseudoceratinae]
MPRILIVEDCRVQQRLIQQLIARQAGWEGIGVNRGAAALEMMVNEPIDLVVCDLRMPEMDGLEFLRLAQEAYPLVPVIIVTAQGSEEVAVTALREGAADYVPKRNLMTDLIARIERVLNASQRSLIEHELQQCVTFRRTELVIGTDRTVVPSVVAMLQSQLDPLGVCDDKDRIRIGVALEEALVNAVIHGNLEISSELRGVDDNAFAELVLSRSESAPWCQRQVHCMAEISRTRARFVIRDEGPGFDPSSLPDPTIPENLEKASGRGLLLIRTFMDDVRYNDTGNEITLEKHFVKPTELDAIMETVKAPEIKSPKTCQSRPVIDQTLVPCD